MEESKTSKDNKESKMWAYHDYGFMSAQHAKSKPESIVNFLENVYEKFLNEQKLDEKGLKDRISQLRAEVQQKKAKKNETSADLASNKQYKENKDKEIEQLEIEKIDVKNGEAETGDTIPFVIGAFITILLTFYLFVFYSSSGYSAFYGVKPESLGFINPNVFADAKNKGGGVIALIILFPVIFLGLGFLIHDALEKNKKNVAEKKPRKYLTIIALLLLTLIADAFIGYKISQGIHTNEFNSGITESLWKFNMIYSDINFYLVLILGFVVYVIWGFLLNYVLSHSYLKTESEKTKLLVENINLKIAEKREELAIIVSKINNLTNLIFTIDNDISEKENDIIGYENGVIPVSIPLLKASVGEFMGGWGFYTNGAFRDQGEEFILEANIIKQTWLDNKISNLN